MKIAFLFSVLLTVAKGRQGFGPGEQDWGYVTVRPQAHMFWWLYETTADVPSKTDRPLIIWLQGGPGASSSGLGNFGELGPLDIDLKPRNYTWIKNRNVLFIDNPVGTGFSYVDRNSAFATTNTQVAHDLITCLNGFYEKHPEFLNVPLYIAAQSYGGKFAVEFALELDKKIKAGNVKSNLEGIALIDCWISPIDSVLTWAPYLYNIGALDRQGYNIVHTSAQRIKSALDDGRFELATKEWKNTQHSVNDVTFDVDWYNILTSEKGKEGFGPGEQDWGYVTVRPGAHKFWWLYETTANVANITERPLVIWLQGGPGGSSTGFGNFAELGPLDVDLNPRNHTWVKDVNVLFIDNPVGTGYSYVDNTSALTTTNKQIADDLIACLNGFYDERPEFQDVPLYITSESYGGKMTAEFALELDKKIKAGDIKSNLKGAQLIDSWISPIESVLNWAPFLYNVGAIDQEGYDAVDEGAQRTKAALDAGEYEKATDEWGRTEVIIMRVAKNVDFYNILKKIPTTPWKGSGKTLILPGTTKELSEDEKIELLMNGPVKEALNINITWGAQRGVVFDTLAEDFMKPVTHIVERLLNETDIKVQVVTGQLDLIVDTPGTLQWVDQLQWTRSNEWKQVRRDALSVNGINEGYQKILGQFSFYWVNRAGHMVPADNPDAMGAILQDLIN